MRKLSEPVTFIGTSVVVRDSFENRKIEVKSDNGFTERYDITSDALDECKNLVMGDKVQLLLLEWSKTYQRKDGSGSFVAQRKLVQRVLSGAPCWVE